MIAACCPREFYNFDSGTSVAPPVDFKYALSDDGDSSGSYTYPGIIDAKRDPSPRRRFGWPYQLPPPVPWSAPRRIERAVRVEPARPRIVRQHRDSFTGRAGTLRRWKAKHRA